MAERAAKCEEAIKKLKLTMIIMYLFQRGYEPVELAADKLLDERCLTRSSRMSLTRSKIAGDVVVA